MRWGSPAGWPTTSCLWTMDASWRKTPPRIFFSTRRTSGPDNSWEESWITTSTWEDDGMVESAEIFILCEDQARMGFRDRIFIGQHGLSLFVRVEKDVLFDTGPSGVFRHNASLLGIDPDQADCVVLSHGHWDHTDGIFHLGQNDGPGKLVAHPGIFANRHKKTGKYNGMGPSQKELEKRFDLQLVREPLALTDSLYFLGEIPRSNDFESVNTTFFLEDNGENRPDFLL